METAVEKNQITNGLRCSKCAFRHEKVRREADGISPVEDPIKESGYTRLGLCSHESRQSNLTCAHTGARHELIRRISNSDDRLINSETKSRWEKCVKDLDFEIVMLDYQKNNAEVEHANLSKIIATSFDSDPDTEQQLELVEERIQQIITSFHLSVDKVNELVEEINSHIELVQGEGN